MPKVSVVIPCHNLGQYLNEAVSSVLAQDYADLEVIVVDDGSDDPATCRLLESYQRPKTTLIRTQNLGVAAARNAGIALASGEYILPLDADDRIAPAYLAKAIAILDRQPEAGIVYCKAEFFGELHGEWRTPAFSLPHMLLDNQIFSAALFRRGDWLAVGGYDEDMRTGWEDWDFWLRLLGLGRQPVRLEENLFSYRIRQGSRERSLVFGQKVRLMGRLILNHFRLYAVNLPAILRIVLTGARRPPEAIKVQ